MTMLISLLMWALQIYSFVLVARALMTWIPNLDYSNPIVRFLINVTEPVLRPVRQMLPSNSGADFSPLIVLVGIMLIRMVLGQMVWSF